MAQHFLLSAKARTLSVTKVARMEHDEARQVFQAIRWAANDGEAYCPRCGCVDCYGYASRPIWKCKGCGHQFSVTSGTIFASRKLPIRDYLLAIAIFVNAVKGISALQLGRDLDVQYKTAFVLAHKLREAMYAEQAETLSGDVEVDGAYFGGYVRPENRKEDRRDRRLAKNQTGKRRVVVVMRQREGRTVTNVFEHESDSVDMIAKRVTPGSTVYADEASSWDELHAKFAMKRVNHSISFMDDDGACTNQAESFFSRMRRAEWGQHHHLSGKYLAAYAGEMAFREDNRRETNGAMYQLVTAAALAHPVSRVWKGYWQR